MRSQKKAFEHLPFQEKVYQSNTMDFDVSAQLSELIARTKADIVARTRKLGVSDPSIAKAKRKRKGRKNM